MLNKLKPWLMLISRLSLFIGIQALFALIFYLVGKDGAWNEAANYWPVVVTIANFICVFLLIKLFKSKGESYWSLFKINKETIKGDLIYTFVVLLIAAPISYLPNMLLANTLFADANTALELLVRPLPYTVAIISMFTFSITQGLAEIPVYFSYVMPELEKKKLPIWATIGIPAFFLGLQHIAVPLLFNMEFILYRGLMFLPFAILVGIVMKKRPRLLPYLAIVHILMDLSFAVMLLEVAY